MIAEMRRANGEEKKWEYIVNRQANDPISFCFFPSIFIVMEFVLTIRSVFAIFSFKIHSHTRTQRSLLFYRLNAKSSAALASSFRIPLRCLFASFVRRRKKICACNEPYACYLELCWCASVSWLYNVIIIRWTIVNIVICCAKWRELRRKKEVAKDK